MFELIKSVIVKDSKTTFSGVLLDNKFILVSSHFFVQNSNNKQNGVFWLIDKNSENKTFNTRKAFFVGNLFNNNIKTVLRRCFTDIYDYHDNVQDIFELFTIYILSFDKNASVEDLKTLWLSKIKHAVICSGSNLKIGDEIVIRAAPFGSKHFINSYSQGIVSNYVSGILLTDCPTVVGCEGAVVIDKTRNVPVGVVVSSMAGWRGEWTGLTLAVTFEALFTALNNHESTLLNKSSDLHGINNINQTNQIKKSLLYIQCGSSWGTGICVDKKKRLLLTNSHVITCTTNKDSFIRVISGIDDVSSKAEVLFKTPTGMPFDLAILECKDLTLFQSLENVTFSNESLNVGDKVYTLGFPIFSHDKHMCPTMTQGYVSLVKQNLVMTTCTVLPGASGGALCDQKGRLVGVVTCNIYNTEDGISYPRVNMCIPASVIKPVITSYLKSGDISYLNDLILDEDKKDGWAISKL